MNHHLRFVSSAILAAGAILFASSCSTTKVGPLLAKPEHEITYEIRIFDVPVDHDFGSRSSEVLSATQGTALIRRLHREPAFFATTSGKLGETKTVSNRKEFIYPSAYSPAEFAKPGETGIFPVTPAQPKDFVTTWVGTTVAFKEMRSSSPRTGLRCPDSPTKLRRKSTPSRPANSSSSGTPRHPHPKPTDTSSPRSGPNATSR